LGASGFLVAEEGKEFEGFPVLALGNGKDGKKAEGV
jgi:hypothetical protein